MICCSVFRTALILSRRRLSHGSRTCWTCGGFLDEHGGRDVEIIAKIENQTGIDNVEEICQACSGIMIGRGDLGVEVPFAELPAIQKYLVQRAPPRLGGHYGHGNA